MKRNVVGFIFILMTALFLAACGGKSIDLKDYVEVDFEGMDSLGHAYVNLSIDEGVAEAYKLDTDNFDDSLMELMEKKPKVYEEIINLFNSYDYEIDQSSDLSNGDVVTVTLTVSGEEAEKVLKGGEVEFTVEGLEEPEELTKEELEKHIVVDFVGASGKGDARINNTFSDDLGYIDFSVENDGSLSNGDEAKLVVPEEEHASLLELGYKVADDADVTYEVSGLTEYAETAEDIDNIQDLIRMMDEEMKENFKDSEYFNAYDIKQEKFLYRQFPEEEESYYDGSTNNGSFMSLYTIVVYDNAEEKADKNPDHEYIYAKIYRDLAIDEDGKVNVAKIAKDYEDHDSSYSLDTVQQVYEGNGYNESDIKVEKKKKSKKKDKKEDE